MIKIADIDGIPDHYQDLADLERIIEELKEIRDLPLVKKVGDSDLIERRIKVGFESDLIYCSTNYYIRDLIWKNNQWKNLSERYFVRNKKMKLEEYKPTPKTDCD